MSNHFELKPSAIDVEPIDILDTDHDGRVRILVHWEHSPIDSHLSETLNYFLAVKEFEGDQNLFIPTLHVVNRVSIIIIMATTSALYRIWSCTCIVWWCIYILWPGLYTYKKVSRISSAPSSDTYTISFELNSQIVQKVGV